MWYDAWVNRDENRVAGYKTDETSTYWIETQFKSWAPFLWLTNKKKTDNHECVSLPLVTPLLASRRSIFSLLILGLPLWGLVGESRFPVATCKLHVKIPGLYMSKTSQKHTCEIAHLSPVVQSRTSLSTDQGRCHFSPEGMINSSRDSISNQHVSIYYPSRTRQRVS